MPAIVQAVIFLVNGNLGTGLAVMGAFTLIRFRSVAGSAKDITCIFFAMAVGLATGMGYALYAVLFTVVVGGSVFSAVHDRLRGEYGGEEPAHCDPRGPGVRRHF